MTRPMNAALGWALPIAGVMLLVGVPLMRGDGAPPPPRAPAAPPGMPDPADTVQLKTFLAGMRGAAVLPCELGMHALDNLWFSDDPVPDRNPEAWQLITAVKQPIVDPGAVALLAAGLRDRDPCVRRVASRLLGRSRLPAARTALLAALRDSDPSVRRLGALGLGFSDDAKIAPSLVPVLRDADASVRAAAAWAIGAVH